MGLYEDIWTSAMRASAGRCRSGHGVLRIKGRDTVEFLQRICAQDVAALSPGQAAWTAFLTSKGKLEAVGCLGRVEDGLWIECPAEVRQSLIDLLERYHFAEDLSIEAVDDFTAVEVSGPTALAGLGIEPMTCVQHDDGSVLYGFARHGHSWARCHGPTSVIDSLPKIADLPECPADLAESLRILRGELHVGKDADGRTLALEAGLEDHLSTSKGCYIGQEIVARIHTYGHVNRALTLLNIDSLAEIEAGTTLHEGEKGAPVGRVTSSVVPPGMTFRLGLGYLPEAFRESGCKLGLGRGGGPEVTVQKFDVLRI